MEEDPFEKVIEIFEGRVVSETTKENEDSLITAVSEELD